MFGKTTVLELIRHYKGGQSPTCVSRKLTRLCSLYGDGCKCLDVASISCDLGSTTRVYLPEIDPRRTFLESVTLGEKIDMANVRVVGSLVGPGDPSYEHVGKERRANGGSPWGVHRRGPCSTYAISTRYWHASIDSCALSFPALTSTGQSHEVFDV